MPEGPSIVLLKEAVQPFVGQTIVEVGGNTKVDKAPLFHQKVRAFKSWGKHFLICFDGFAVRIHMLMFGSYLVNAAKDKPARLSLIFKNGVINFYACSVKIIAGNVEEVYDFSSDVMSETWNPEAAREKLSRLPEMLVCDALLTQEIFAGVGNIIKNEVLYRVRIHPKSEVGKIPDQNLHELIAEARNYSFDFLAWKRDFVLKQHWLAHTKKICLRCDLPMIKEYTGNFKRRSFFCVNCQVMYG